MQARAGTRSTREHRGYVDKTYFTTKEKDDENLIKYAYLLSKVNLTQADQSFFFYCLLQIRKNGCHL